jgi:hypothetical protein
MPCTPDSFTKLSQKIQEQLKTQELDWRNLRRR